MEGCLEVIHGSGQAGGTTLATGLTAEVLDVVVFATAAITDEGMDGGVGDGEEVAAGIEAGEAASIDDLGTTGAALALSPGNDIKSRDAGARGTSHWHTEDSHWARGDAVALGHGAVCASRETSGGSAC